MMWYWGPGMSGWGWGIGAFTTLIFLGLIIWAIVALVRWTRATGPGPGYRGTWQHGDGAGEGPRGDDPEQILARRFAAGEIDAGEYHERLSALRARHDRPGRQSTAAGDRH